MRGRHKEHRRDGNKANQLKMRFLRPRPTRRHKEHRMDTSKANPFEQNGKRLGKLKLTRQSQKYETTLLGRQRTGSGLTYLRRCESKASQLKRHGKHIGKPTRKTTNTKPITRKSHWGLEPVFRNKAHKDKEPRVTHLKRIESS